MAQTVHAIVGDGEASPKAIIEALRDAVDEGDAVNLVWSGKPNDSVAAVYDYVTDEKLDFTIFYEDGAIVPNFLRNFETGTAQKSRDPEGKALKETTGKVLVLWNDDNAQDLVEKVFDNIGEGTLVLELTNGLTPIELAEEPIIQPDGSSKYDEASDESTTEEEPAATGDEGDDLDFTKAELENMGAPAVKRYGVKKGTEATTKKGIIAELFVTYDNPDDSAGKVVASVTVVNNTDPDVAESSEAAKVIVSKHQLKRSLSNVKPSDQGVETIEALRNYAWKLGDLILETAPSRERSLAVTHLEETVMWAVKNVVLTTEEV